MTTNDLRIFISYAREDGRELAIRLRDDLTSFGYPVWLDVSEISGGASWSQEIEDAIEGCDIALALLSHASYQSPYCRAEQLRAIRKGKRVIPVLVQADADRPIHLEHINYLDFSSDSRYSAMLRDLLSDLTATRAFRVPGLEEPEKTSSVVFKSGRAQKSENPEKRDARAFRRLIEELRQESWLGSRYWWPYFLFTYIDIHELGTILKSGALSSTLKKSGRKNTRWDEMVRLYFRPRTPDLWHTEGIRPASQRKNGTCSIPVYLLFDLEAVICQPNSRFSAGDPAQTNKTWSNSTAFSELPFESIYHDSSVRADERDEIMQSRRAQVLVPEQLGLESLQFIWCRSNAEYEMLRYLLPPDVWRQWRDKITARTDYTLFNRRWTYIEDVLLENDRIYLKFNYGDGKTVETFDVRIEVNGDKQLAWREPKFTMDADLTLELPSLKSYEIRVYLDDVLAYANRYRQNDGVL